MRLIRIGAFFLLTLGLANAFAEPGTHRRDARDAVRAYHIQSVTMERSIPPDPARGQQPQELRRQGSGASESSGYGSVGETQASQQADNTRRQGRMTPEERRALRRQIDEVGHDIYAPKR